MFSARAAACREIKSFSDDRPELSMLLNVVRVVEEHTTTGDNK